MDLSLCTDFDWVNSSKTPANRPYSVIVASFSDTAKMIDCIFKEVKEEFGIGVHLSDRIGHSDNLTVKGQVEKVGKFIAEYATKELEDSSVKPAIRVQFSKDVHTLFVRESFGIVTETSIFDASTYVQGRPRVKRIEFGFHV